MESAAGPPGARAGALAGALLALALLGAFHLGWILAGLPFVPFDTFDWLVRRLPGPVVTFAIAAMVRIIGALDLGGTAEVAKTAEQAMAVTSLLLAGAAGGALLFAVLAARPEVAARRAGLVLGAATGVPAALIGYSLTGTATVSPALASVWTLAAFLGWGAACGWTFERLARAEGPRAPAESATAAGGSAAGSLPAQSALAEVVPEGHDLAAPAATASVERLDRRRFLIRLGGAAAAISVSGTVVGALVGRDRRGPAVVSDGRWSATHPLPNAGAAVQAAPGTRPELTPLERHYRIDINLIPRTLQEQDWRLQVRGLVEAPLDLTLDELRAQPPLHQFVTLSCISNEIGGDLIGTTRWTGLSLRRLLPRLRLRPEATHLRVRAADGFFEIVALDLIRDDERVMLAYAWDGVPLLPQHGFPLRIYIPDRYGMKQPKWITAIEAIGAWEPGYWVMRGWDREARMRATSVIDTVAVHAATTDGSGRRLVPIGGIAHAGARGISRVEVQVDGGPWQPARLRDPLSGTTWVIWRYDWPFTPGTHTLAVRCTDGEGLGQIVEPAPPQPSGATGLHRRRVRL
ncbi:MAG: molybdopterin-dependent oxidoreductase [Armatimonadota bacterium]|nr:molybdopterin-dependent oxidoreductase [Armatimonadota bacterium]